MIVKKVLITGSNGQLGQCLKELSKTLESNLEFVFTSSKTLDITNNNQVLNYFNQHNFDYCINCAAYTAVDNAEDDIANAEKVNIIGIKNIAEACLLKDTKLIHVSTDFVFEGTSITPYTEEDKTNPISIYGKTKLKGEKEVTNNLTNYFIIRTSWLYSEYGNNFVKTMLRLGKDRDSLSVVNDQTGTPTYAKDLAKVLLKIIDDKNTNYGIYHYSNDGEVSWYDFAKAIFNIYNIDINLSGISTKDYVTKAERPIYSVLNKEKIKKNINVEIPYWETSLKDCLKAIRFNS